MRIVGHPYSLLAAILALFIASGQIASAQLFGPAKPAPMKSAADLIHLAEGERWLQLRIARGEVLGTPEVGAIGHANGGTRPNAGDA